MIEIGYWLAPFATGRGCVTRAARALTAAALELPDVTRVEIHMNAPNESGMGMVWVFPGN